MGTAMKEDQGDMGTAMKEDQGDLGTAMKEDQGDLGRLLEIRWESYSLIFKATVEELKEKLEELVVEQNDSTFSEKLKKLLNSELVVNYAYLRNAFIEEKLEFLSLKGVSEKLKWSGTGREYSLTYVGRPKPLLYLIIVK